MEIDQVANELVATDQEWKIAGIAVCRIVALQGMHEIDGLFRIEALNAE